MRLRGSTCAAVLAAASACGGNSPVPCTDCIDVGGNYVETAATSEKDCGNAHRLYFTGGRGTAHLDQQGSKLLYAVGSWTMDGVLHSDGSATFGPIPAVAYPVGGSGELTPGRVWLEGWFKPTSPGGRAASFAGTYLFIADRDGCEIDARTSWKR